MTTIAERPTSATILPESDPASLGLDPARIDQLMALIEVHVAGGRYPGAAVAIARHGQLAAARTFGAARLGVAASAATRWLLFSQTKVVTAAAVWQLVDQGLVRFADSIADHVPEFAQHGKGDVTLFEVLTHQGGFPNAVVPPAAYADHELLRRTVAGFTLEWTPGSRVAYHGLSAHWVAAVLIEAVTGRDYRAVIRDDLLAPLGLDDLVVGVPAAEHDRCADMHHLADGAMVAGPEVNSAAWRSAGVPGASGYATAPAMAAFYQMLLAGGRLNGARVLSPRVIQFATRNHTEERVDEYMGMPMHRGLGPHVRGLTPTIRGLGTLASPATYGHGGVGSSYSWADPDSGVSFTYLSNARLDEPWHTIRLDQISNLAHAAIVEV